MKNRFGRLTESRKLEMLQMSVEEIYNAGCNAGEISGKLNAILKPTATKSPNQRRAELIQRAREFVEKQLSFDIKILRKEMYRYCNAEFIVNTEKRTVVCLLKGRQTNSVWSKAKTKCHPHEVFNEWIGKAIALARALEIEIPQEFMNAVQPDVPVVGMVVKRKLLSSPTNVTRTLTKEVEPGFFRTKEAVGTTDIDNIMEILDDSSAEYEVPSC